MFSAYSDMSAPDDTTGAPTCPATAAIRTAGGTA